MMMQNRPFLVLRRLGGDRTGGALVEFALLAPLFIAMMIGVLQIGVYMQNYTAVRSLASDAARFATVEYQKSNDMSASDMEDNIKAMAIGSPYNLTETSLRVLVTPATSPVSGALKYDMAISYDVPSFISGVGFSDITLDYSRPLFVIDNSTGSSSSTSGGT